MLNVSLHKLVARGPEQMFAQQPGLGMRQGHDVLQLIAKAERSARLIEATAPPETACQRLIYKPAVQQNVDRRIGRLDVHCTESPIPIFPHSLERNPRCCGSIKSARQVIGFISASPGPEREYDFTLLAVFQIESNTHGRTRVETCAHSS